MRRIRDGKAADMPALEAIQTAALAQPWPELLEAANAGGGVLLVIEVADRVVGYAIAIGAGGEPAYVPEFAVHPSRHGAGHGSALMDALLDRLRERGHAAVRLTVREQDERARSFYESAGFSAVRRLPDEFESDDGILLERPLENVEQQPE